MSTDFRVKALRVFYKTYNPEKLAHVDLFMKKFRGKEVLDELDPRSCCSRCVLMPLCTVPAFDRLV